MSVARGPAGHFRSDRGAAAPHPAPAGEVAESAARRIARCAVVAACAGILLACDGSGADLARPAPATARPTPPAATVSPPAAAPRAQRNRVMGTGEAPIPQTYTLDQQLLEAVRQGDRAGIEKAVGRGASLDAKDDLQRSTVLLAVLDAGDLDLVKWLHARGVALDEADVGGRTPLSYAAARGSLATVRYLLENGATVDSRDMQQRTPLFHAALGDRPEVIDELVRRGAAVDARDQFADTPLIAACAKGNAAAAAALIEHGADPGLRDQEGRSARERAAPGTTPCLPATPGQT